MAAMTLGAAAIRPEIAIIVLMAGVIVTTLLAQYTRHVLGREYKMGLALAIVPLLRPGLTFHPTGSIGVREFNALGLFHREAERVTAEDEVRGAVNDVSYAVEEVRATYTTTSGTGKSRRRTTHTIFRGVAIRLEFNKHFHGHTVVVPEYFGAGLLGGLFDGIRRTVSLENAEFERAFIVKSSDQHEARYLLTPRFMEVVMEARAALGDIRLAFHGDTLAVLIPGRSDRFEVSLFRGVSPADIVNDLDAVIRLAEQLVSTFDLETRVWSRV